MARLTSDLEAKILVRIAVKEAQLDLANATYNSILAKDIESYKLDTGAGEQWVKNLDLVKIQQAVETLESEIDLLYRRLNGSQVVNIRMRRKW